MGESQESATRSFKNVGITVSQCKPVTEGKTVWELKNWSSPKDFNLLKKHANCVVEDVDDGASLRFFLKEEKYSEKDLIKGYSPTTEVECLSLYVSRMTPTDSSNQGRNAYGFGYSIKVTVDFLNETLDTVAGPPGYRSVPVTHLSFEGTRADSELLVFRAFILISSKITKHSFGEFEPIEELYQRPDTLRYGITIRFYKCAEAANISSKYPSRNVIGEHVPDTLIKSPDTVSHDFEWMFSQKDNFSDVKLHTKDGVFINTHKFILAARSPKLREMITYENKRNDLFGTLKVGDVNSKAMIVILNWMYSGKLDEEEKLAGNIVEEVIVAAAKYELAELLNLCDRKLITICNSINMLFLFQLAQKYGLKSAVKSISTYISKNIEKSVSQLDA